MNNLTIIQWNIRSFSKNKSDLENIANTEKADIILLSETWLKKGTFCSLTGFNLFRRDREEDKMGGGVAIAVKRHLMAKEVTTNTDREILTVKVRSWGQEYTFTSIYVPPDKTIDDDIGRIMFRDTRNRLLVGGDFNAHHSLWGSPTNSGKGKKLVEAADEYGMIVKNTGEETRLGHPRRAKSAVDVTFVSADLAGDTEWRVGEEALGSDHYPITIRIKRTGWRTNQHSGKENCQGTIAIINKGIRLNREEWAEVARDCDKLREKQHIETAIIHAARNKAITKGISGIKRRIRPEWWNKKCEEAAKKRTEANKTYRTLKSETTYIMLRRAVARHKREVTEARRDGWAKVCERMNPSTTLTSMWRMVNCFRKNTTGNHTFTGRVDWLEEFLDRNASPFVEQELNINLDTNSNSGIGSPFTMGELEDVLSKLRSTAPGPDGVPYDAYVSLSIEARIGGIY